MTIYQLECFIAVAEELNFSAAAERLFTTQPPDVKIGTTIFSKKQKKISRIKFPIGLNPLESPMRLIRTYFNY